MGKLKRLQRQLADVAYVTGFGGRKTNRQMFEAQYGAPGPINQMEPVQDPQNQTAASLLSLHQTGRMLVGMVTDTVALAQAYRIQFTVAKQPVVGVLGSHSTCSIMGAKSLNNLQPGTLVVCYWGEEMPWAVIIAALPTPGRSAKQQMATVLLNSNRARVDEAHKKPIRTKNNGHIPDFLSGRPYDHVMVGSQGWITETGLRIYIDPFLAMIGADELTQVAAFYHDQLLRVAGYNLQIWSSVRECESFNDQCESQDWTGYALYPWEQLGRVSATVGHLLKTAKGWQQEEPHYGKVEPTDDWAMPLHREREFHGYLGQGGKRIVTGLPFPYQEEGHLAYSGGSGTSEPTLTGHFDSFVTQDGRLCIAAVKGVSLAKRAGIVSPVRRQRPDGPSGGDGDDETNYKFSSQVGDGADHIITGDIAADGADPQFQRALGLADMHAYFFNYSGLHPFYWHSQDYKVYEESELSYLEGQAAPVPVFSELGTSMYLDPSQYRKSWQVDHRYGEQNFYTLPCGLDLLDDGGVVIYDGFGGEIRMTAGSIFLSAPGDIWLKSGRNCISWAGFDVILRAKNSIDGTATNHDVRFKAENNMQLLASGVLVEGRGSQIYNFEEFGESVQSGGVMLRAPNASVVSWAESVYLRTGGGDISNGPIVLDAGKGESGIVCYAQHVQNYLQEGVFWHFNVIGGETEGPSGWITEGSIGLPGTVFVKDSIVSGGSGIFDGSVAITGAYAAVEGAPFVGKLDGEALAAIQAAIAEAKQELYYTIPQDVGATYYDGILEILFYAANKPGNDDVISKAEASLRTQDDYQTQDFKLYEDRWQQLGRQAGTAFMSWEEKPVIVQGQETYPYPGKEAFDGDKLFKQDVKIFNPMTGNSADRGESPNLDTLYATPQFQQPVAQSLHEYLVIR